MKKILNKSAMNDGLSGSQIKAFASPDLSCHQIAVVASPIPNAKIASAIQSNCTCRLFLKDELTDLRE